MTQGGPRAATLGTEWLRGLDAALERSMVADWPSSRWANDPIGFAHDVLGVETWGKQQSILESVRDNRHTTVSGGRKVGKDFVGGIAAIWWFASVEKGKTMLFGPTMKQVDGIIYLEIRQLWMGHGRCVKCKRDKPGGPRPCPHSGIMPEKPSLSAAGGIKAKDLRSIVGSTSVADGGARGFSGRILAIEDEAADMKDSIDDSIVGNLAADNTRRLLISNPTRTRGFFFRSHHTERAIYGGIFQISSEESPNIIAGREVLKGLASREWLAERERAWGRGSPMWTWHVEGKFLKAEQGQLFTIDSVTDAEMRHATTSAAGRLYIGIDVAGETNDGDETAFCVRRGDLMLALEAERAITAERIVQRTLVLMKRHGRPGDLGDSRPVIVVDRDGATGARVYNELYAYERAHESAFEVVGFRGSEKPKGTMGLLYPLNRDLLYGGLFAWLKPSSAEHPLDDGGAILVDLMLEAELLEMRWVDNERNRQILIPKDQLRKRLDRSPDRCDALALSTWGEAVAVVHPVTPETRVAKPTPRVNVYEAEDARDDDLVYGTPAVGGDDDDDEGPPPDPVYG